MFVKQLVSTTVLLKLFTDPTIWIVLGLFKKSSRLSSLPVRLPFRLKTCASTCSHTSTRGQILTIHFAKSPSFLPKGAKLGKNSFQFLPPVALYLLQLLHQSDGEQAENIVECIFTEGFIP